MIRKGMRRAMYAAGTLGFAGWSLAQTEPASGPSSAVGSNWFDHFVVSGGWIGYIIVGLSLVAVTLIVEHFISIRRQKLVAPESAGHLRDLLERKKYVDAIHFTSEDDTMLSGVVNAGLLEASNGYAAMERAMEEELEGRSARLFRKIEYLNIIGNVSPMIGLFGTVFGLIRLFGSIGERGRIPEANLVAENISIALVTTFWGLLVAIPALGVYGFMRNRIDILTAECAQAADRLLSIFKPGAGHGSTGSLRREPAGAAATAVSTM
ncbi:MAG: MotA/TolQ/ExbB proton channel family protein [Phycisphaerae bacterium]|nr:MAG: MotA/TolQ/ExbB proton channel family protein [Phycisphaerae bacterium]MBE7455739.1 MotA/TolQ/ExbB proton channel family protein [Planctomycetia bacterium]MCK6463375.1 MotA/TolQ/ExbB proton channel family protein [Phycisphaerae bacterium]MCL4716997.1 MotA/TolQ/ExbB proton channel family protein [Phycisphaerae bacterium]NUQ08141.1 MotA/TolQ/ExbB proton channel family protein [Phycisphaerae bacterium]